MKRINPFGGFGVALITPFTSEGAVDVKALRALVERQINSGTDFLCVLGTTAETPCLSAKEKLLVVNIVREVNAGRLPLLLGAGGNCTAEVAEGLKETDLTGIDGVLIVTPYYNKPTQEGLYQHFRMVAQSSPLPVILYNVPGRTGVNLATETTLRIAHDCENVVGIKEASGRLDQIEAIIKDAPEGFCVLSGDDAITYELLTLGATGVISVIGNAYPGRFGRMVRSTLQCNYHEGLQLHRSFGSLYRLMSVDGNPSGVKGLCNILGFCQNELRLPLVPATQSTLSEIRAYTERHPLMD